MRWRPKTLFGRTALGLAAAFLLFGSLAAVVFEVALARPYTRQAATDFATFLSFAAKIWVELPPFTRADYARELEQRHQLRIRLAEQPLATPVAPHTYVDFLQQALTSAYGRPVGVHRDADSQGWLFVDLPVAGRVLRLGFDEQRLHSPVMTVLSIVIPIGVGMALIVALSLVRRITRPLAQMTEATHRIGEGLATQPLPEDGPEEIAALASKLNRMESKIRRLLDNRTTLMAGMSHDLRTPLARMRMAVELIGPQPDESLVTGLTQDIEEMEQVISQVLLLARDMGHEMPEAVDPVLLLEGIASAYRKAGHRLTLAVASSAPAMLPPTSLRRAVGNLVDNALKFATDGTVELGCTPEPGGLSITVADHGPAIPDVDRERIFEPFFRRDGSRHPATGGKGLGLAVVSQLCRAYGWQISVERAAVGQGNVFRLYLPHANPLEDRSG